MSKILISDHTKGDIIQSFDIPIKKCPEVTNQNHFSEALQKMKNLSQKSNGQNLKMKESAEETEAFRRPARRPSKLMRMSPKKGTQDRVRKTLKYNSSEESSQEGPDLS